MLQVRDFAGMCETHPQCMKVESSEAESSEVNSSHKLGINTHIAKTCIE